MNENYSNSYNDEMEINLVDLMFYLLKQWKTLLIMAVLGLLLGFGIRMVKGTESGGVAVDEMLEAEEDADIVAEQLKIEPDVITNMELAYQYRQMYEGQINYNQNSILMQLDPNKTYSGSLRYYISAGDNTELISLLYQNMIGSQDFIHELRERTSVQCEEQYVRELIGCSVSNNRDMLVNINNVSGGGTDSTELAPQSAVVAFTAVYSDSETCAAMLDVIREYVDKVTEECTGKYGEYTLENIFDGVQFVADNSRLDKQKSDIDVMNACLTNIIKLEADFTDEERSYYESVYLGRKENTEEDSEAETALEADQNQESAGGMVKWLLIGIMLGIVCWGGYYLVKYLFDKRVKYAEELSNYYRLHLIGRYQPEDRMLKGLDKVQERMVNQNVGSCSSKEYIASAMNLMDEKTLFLIGDLEDQEVEALMQGLKENCSKAEYGNLMQKDSAALETAKEKAGVVFCVRKGKSTHTEIQRELEICRLQNIHVAGAVVVE